ncbi:hypothetical protein [Microvirga guangxiensis]|uniref:Uncharacterized protein n=1 Tax=Microvirga guangxiensis TaxID=549386 RepID=A0A1G5G6G6_9HYPH|nr:hypothetical protein [Microvirga guangxiensis]SCY46957.1 hypothetical protein SAMN02927923_01394 [Microvirga guangxiensis]
MSGKPTPDISLQPISVLSDGGSHEGCLVLSGGDLVAVFAKVSAEENAGSNIQTEGWFLEAGFGPCSILMTPIPPVFPTLDEAIVWVREKLEAEAPST